MKSIYVTTLLALALFATAGMAAQTDKVSDATIQKSTKYLQDRYGDEAFLCDTKVYKPHGEVEVVAGTVKDPDHPFRRMESMMGNH